MWAKRMLVMGTLLAPLLCSHPAAAGQQEVAAKLEEARNCLAFLSSLRDTDSFRELALGGLMREVAANIDYAETWAPHDINRAESYLATDCDAAIVARSEHPAEVFGRPAVATAPEPEWMNRAPIPHDQMRVVQALSNQGMIRRVGYQQGIASPQLDSRQSRR